MAEITKKLLKKLYYKQKLSAVKIARKLNVSPTTIYNYMKKYNLKRNGNKTAKNVKCAYCGKGKEIKLSQYKNNKNKRFFCDSKCMGKWRSENLSGENSHHWVPLKDKTVKCDFCGEEIIKSPALINAYDKHFCDNECKNKWLKENAIQGKEHYNWKGGASRANKKTKCAYCNKEILVTKYRLEGYNNNFCSNECKNKFFGNNHKLENNFNWRGGKSFELYPIEFNDSLKNKIKKRDNNTCQICGVKGKDATLHVHHIDYNKDNSSMNNLITLCNSCHSKTNFDREYWEKFFKNLNKAN
ncbi:MAG: HNH endonuclease [Bacteroidota bacterium]